MLLVRKGVSVNSSQYQRDIQKSSEAIKLANFLCEIDNDHHTFISNSSLKPFVEGHHLIPLSMQEEFQHSVDITENIVALCPTCHRLLHHGVDSEKEPLLLKLWSERKELLHKKGISIDTITFLSYYLKGEN